ncbi:MAG: response regulator [Bacteroidales bacterium]|nr:response regulator [Bacteroidales bacterium]
MKKKILIIDDYAPLLEEVSEFLDMEGYKVETAKNGAEGVQKAITIEPDMIICDILMPELNGYQVFEAISQIPSLSAIPFIFLTARATSEDYRKGLELGVDDYLTKPFTIDALLTTIDKRFEKIEKYKSVKQDVVEFLFSNPLLGVFIYSDNKFIFVNEKLAKVSGYSLHDINNLEFKDFIIGNYIEAQKIANLLKAGIKKEYNTEIGLLKKDKNVVELSLFVKSVVFEGKNSFIGCLVEKEEKNGNSLLEPSIAKFVDFLSTTNNKEISDEITSLYNQMKTKDSIENRAVIKKIKISKREKEILEHICKGFTNKEIADKLFLSARTVDNHRANMLAKTKTKNTAELVAFAVKTKLVEI